MKLSFKHLFAVAAVAGALSAHAAGFAILEQSPRAMGRALAGITADITDPNAQYFNPSAIAWFDHRELSVGCHWLKLTAQYKDTGSYDKYGVLGREEGNSVGGWSRIPNVYYAQPIADNLVFGMSLSATSGTKTEHNRYWVGRYTALLTDIAVVDVAPSLAYRINDDLSFGVGLVMEYASAMMDRALFNGFGQADGKLKMRGDSIAFGYTIGMTYRITPQTTIGLGYRSRMRHDLDMKIRTHNSEGARGTASTKLHLPSSINFGVMHQVNDRWKVAFDLCYSMQSYMHDLRVKYDQDTKLGLKTKTRGSEDRTRLGWRNTFRVSIGQEYKLTDRLTLKNGFAFDQTPVPNHYRNTQLPDTDRYWVSFGFAYKFNDNWTVDCAYTHIFFDSVSLKQESGELGTVKGKFSSCATDTVSVSANYSF